MIELTEEQVKALSNLMDSFKEMLELHRKQDKLFFDTMQTLQKINLKVVKNGI